MVHHLRYFFGAAWAAANIPDKDSRARFLFGAAWAAANGT